MDNTELSADSYRQGGYEASTSPFGPSVADDLIAGQLRQLRELHASKGQKQGFAVLSA